MSEVAVLNANYLLARLRDAYELPFDRLCMHEFVLSARTLKREHGITALDVAKRLMDYGFHPPTVYFPLVVPEALMIEPTETEAKETLDAFVEAMLAIAREAAESPEARSTSAPHGRAGRGVSTRCAPRSSRSLATELRGANEPRDQFPRSRYKAETRTTEKELLEQDREDRRPVARRAGSRASTRSCARRAPSAPFTGEYDHVFEPGTYHCAGCGAELFESDAKYDSGCGWPAFSAPASGEAVDEETDASYGMVRTEVLCAAAAAISATCSRTARSRPACATASTRPR